MPPVTPATPAVWTWTVESVAVSTISPWVGQIEHDVLPIMPAPIDKCYLTVLARVAYQGPEPTVLHLVDREDAAGLIGLAVDDRFVSPLGVLSDPPDHLDPLPIAPISFEATDEKSVPLVFLVPAEATTGRLSIGAKGDTDVSWPALQVGSDGLSGVWHTADTLRRPLRYQDSILTTLTGRGQGVMEIQRTASGGFRFQFPFTDLEATAAAVEPGGSIVEIHLTLGGRDQRARVRLADEGRVLILYAGERPIDRLAYHRQD
ncbi:MAG: hypothetical protein GY778_02340 [bacterium]|nr:hypothetical protein [bacterium]